MTPIRSREIPAKKIIDVASYVGAGIELEKRKKEIYFITVNDFFVYECKTTVAVSFELYALNPKINSNMPIIIKALSPKNIPISNAVIELD
mgnify:CR=1 FL=1